MAAASSSNVEESLQAESDIYGEGNNRVEKWHFYALFDLEHWYEILAEHTFASNWISLSVEESHAVRQLYRWKWLGGTRPSEEEQQRLDQLEGRIQMQMQLMNPPLVVGP